jgi:hypothetical protein
MKKWTDAQTGSFVVMAAVLVLAFDRLNVVFEYDKYILFAATMVTLIPIIALGRAVFNAIDRHNY